MKIIFMHGWGCTGAVWDPLIAQFPKDECGVWDRGYWGQPSLVPFDPAAVYVTHSQGLYDFLEYNQTPRALYILNGFTRFAAAPDWPAGVPARMLSRMQRQWQKNPHQVWTDFMTRAGAIAQPWDDTAHVDFLGQALAELASKDYRAALGRLTCPIHAVGTLDDVIVPETLSEACFSGCEGTMRASGGHFLMQSAPQWVTDHLKHWIGQHL